MHDRQLVLHLPQYMPERQEQWARAGGGKITQYDAPDGLQSFATTVDQLSPDLLANRARLVPA